MKIVVFGAGKRGKLCIKLAMESGKKIVSVMDNNMSKWGECIDDIEIKSPQKIDEVLYVLTVWGYENEIKKQLLNIGVCEKNIINLNEFLMSYISSKDIEGVSRGMKLKRASKPQTLQFPITWKCNFNCVMCGVSSQTKNEDITPEQIGKILSDEFFSDVTNVGINGGEPFIREDIVECVIAIIENLTNLKQISFISNGYFTDKIKHALKEIKGVCKEKGINVFISFSVDGYMKMQDFHRGKNGAFDSVNNTINLILENKDEYVDYLDIICTITKYNIERINEVEVWAESKNLDVAYNIASENERIDNSEKMKECSIMLDEEKRMLAREFFYGKYQESHSERYYSLFLYLSEGKRASDCPCIHNSWITVSPGGELSFCSPYSRKLGTLNGRNAKELVESNIDELIRLKEERCRFCSQYSYELNPEGFLSMTKDIMINESLRQEL